MAMALGKNVRKLRKYKGMDLAALSRLSGVAIGSISALEMRDSARSQFAPQLARALGVDLELLLLDEIHLVDKLGDDAAPLIGYTTPVLGYTATPTKLIDIEHDPDYPAIRMVNITAKAGVTGYAVDYIDEERPPIFFPRDWYDSNGYKPEKLIALRVTGVSMVPRLNPGDLIVVNTAQTQPKQGTAFLVSFEGEVVVKLLVRDDGQWWLTSDNQDQRRYPRVRCNGETEIIGEVVSLQTSVV